MSIESQIDNLDKKLVRGEISERERDDEIDELIREHDRARARAMRLRHASFDIGNHRS